MKNVLLAAFIMINFTVFAQNDSIARNMNIRGFNDAMNSFHTGGVFASTMVCTFLFTPVASLPTTIILSSTPPKAQNFVIKSEKLYDNYDYRCGYAVGARKKKQRAAWGGFATAFGIQVATTIFFITVIK